MRGLLQAVGDRPGRNLGAGTEAELVEDMLDVAFDGTLAKEERACDLPVRRSLRDQRGDLPLPVRQQALGRLASVRDGSRTSPAT